MKLAEEGSRKAAKPRGSAGAAVITGESLNGGSIFALELISEVVEIRSRNVGYYGKWAN